MTLEKVYAALVDTRSDLSTAREERRIDTARLHSELGAIKFQLTTINGRVAAQETRVMSLESRSLAPEILDLIGVVRDARGFLKVGKALWAMVVAGVPIIGAALIYLWATGQL